MKVAGIDVHEKVLMVVVVDASMPEEKPARRRSGSPRKEETCPDAGASPPQARLRGHHHPHRPTCGQACCLESRTEFSTECNRR
jgi:hypothetical protein